MEPAIQRLLLSDRELRLESGSDLAARASALLRHQKETWPLLRSGYEALDRVQTRAMGLDGSTVRVQWNPARIVSSSANVDEESIRQRRCFLCFANLPPDQRALLYASSYLVLCNPYPIFTEHFTIPHITHIPQRIGPAFGTMLDLARAMQKRYTVTYNGPRSGASAPDHHHFQAGEKGFLPLESEYARLLPGARVLADGDALQAFGVEEKLRRFIVLRSGDRRLLLEAFHAVESAFAQGAPGDDEPMLNIIAWFGDEGWTVLIFPRAKHRPSVYFAKGDARILISPAATECGGVLTTPLEKDYERLTTGLVREIFGEVIIPEQSFQAICTQIDGSLNRRIRR